MTRWPGITAPLAAVALLAGACGSTDGTDPMPRVSPAGGPALERAWRIPDLIPAPATRNTPTASPMVTAGNLVVVQAESSGDDSSAVFVDATKGKTIARGLKSVADLTYGTAHLTSDEFGNRLVAIDCPLDGGARGRYVYSMTGYDVSSSDERLYAGGYTAEPLLDGAKELEITAPSGKVAARLPLPGYTHDPYVEGVDENLDFRIVRPGLLMASGVGAHKSQIALIDVSHPGRSRVTMLRPPTGPDGPDAVRVDVTDGHLYAAWLRKGSHPRFARYDLPDTRPVWQRRAQIDGIVDAIRAYPGRNGEDGAVEVTGEEPQDDSDFWDRYWLLRPDTGAPIGRRGGYPGNAIGVSGGRSYAVRNGPHGYDTTVVDLRTGKTRRLDGRIDGVTANGYLIGGRNALTAYRWN